MLTNIGCWRRIESHTNNYKGDTMRHLLKVIAVLSLIACCSSTAVGQSTRGSADEATAMAKRAVAEIKKVGRESAFREIADTDNKQFHEKDLYVFVYDIHGIAVAHGNNPKMVGKNLLELKDVNGVPIIRNFIDTVNAKGSGWVDYQWPNPVTKAIEKKSSYVEKADQDLIVGVGIYK
jgi:signal transduction histidine kinase